MSDEVISTPFGKFLIDPQDLIGSTLKAGTLWDGPGFLQPIALEYGRLGEVGTTILDVGANIGAFSVWLARQGAWRVIAVEAIGLTMQRLKANLDLNKEVTADHVIPLEIAAYDRIGRLGSSTIDPGNVGGTCVLPQGEVVMGAPLDDFRWVFGERVSLIKLDIQGCELRALDGLIKTMQRWKPTIVFEWEADLALAHGDRWPMVEVFFAARQYCVHPWPSQPNNFLALPQ